MLSKELLVLFPKYRYFWDRTKSANDRFAIRVAMLRQLDKLQRTEAHLFSLITKQT